MQHSIGLFLERTIPYEPVPQLGLVQAIEVELGVRLPAAYVDLALVHNGGDLARDAYPTQVSTSWAPDHVGVKAIAAIGRTAPFSLCGEFGNRFWIREWGYPDIGIYFADTPTAGHDMIALDYRSPGEPSVVHVDQEVGYQITPIAPDLATFISGLVPSADFE
ncbi:SMI1/KNR4 family protein [Nocardioides sp. YIM 152588]|uniref:SMI1/KNR4 family protein n=1 Tax=Nocardioides sp. YIM 152588 TaxID=3158259 RepID=UPI0032E4DA27